MSAPGRSTTAGPPRPAGFWPWRWRAHWPAHWPLPGRVPLRLRLFFRGVFLLLALATLAMAVGVLQEEKQLGHRHYQLTLRKTQAQILARLRHPTGQLALLNPRASGDAGAPLRPLVLPFSAIDFDDKTKVQQAVEMAGCLVQYPDGANLCVAVGNNPFAGGFLYLAGSFASGALAPHEPGDLDFGTAHRVRVSVAMRGQTYRWIAPFELLAEGATVGPSGAPGLRGRLTGYVDGPIVHGTRSVRDFRGWLWQDGRCLDDKPGAAQAITSADCAKRSFLSLRLPIEIFRDALFQADRSRLVWPPPDLAQIRVRLQVLPPGEGAPIFDSDTPGAEPPFALADLAEPLLPGERLRIRRQGAREDLIVLTGRDTGVPASPWLDRLIRRLPVEGYDTPLMLRETVATPLGRYDVVLEGDVRSVNKALAAVATRVSGFVGAMLAAVLLAWVLLELRIIRRITLLTRRAASVSSGVAAAAGGGLAHMDLTDLRGSDELGVLAQGLQDLLQRVNEDLRREQIRTAQEKDQWHAVGHEIMSPLQSLLALHPDADDPSHRYLSRMQQAVRVLYGQASPSEAFESTTLRLGVLDLALFLAHVAANADAVGIADVRFEPPGHPVPVRADEYSLEDVVTHVLRNAERHRRPGTPIMLSLAVQGTQVRVEVHNQGEPIPDGMLERIFEYGVSDQPGAGAEGHRGQGLFVARTYMAKMGGTITAHNTAGGVSFALVLPRAAAG
ncbi:MAG: HAMP domain-containing histidine kinase [Burkholderiales bacterium]|nr:HAMP domain-containing histidine kinase [Burkholderiales bacterium]